MLKSRARIELALKEARAAFGATPGADWLTGYYQYTDRLAHLHFLRCAGVKAWLVFLYFTNDEEMQRPDSEEAWCGHLAEVHRQLGIPAETPIPGVINVFLDARVLQ